MSHADLSHKRILVVDDFNEMRRTLRRMLEGFGVKYITDAANAHDALIALTRDSFDIVFCDYNLGEGKNGQQILEEARHRHLINAQTAFIMITAEMGQDMVLGVVDYKPDDYLTKPFVAGVLRKRLDRVLQRKAVMAEIEEAMAARDHARALELCDARIAEKPRNLYELLQLKSHVLIESRQYEQARNLLAEVLAERAIPWAQFNLAKVAACSGEHPQAIELLEALIGDNPMFMEAYDWLASSYGALGEPGKAQEAMNRAVAVSPRSLTRQRELGRLAYENNDVETAGRSFRRAVSLGKESYLKSLDDYTGLARSMASSGEGVEALRVIDAARKEFKGDNGIELQTAVVESVVHQKLGQPEKAREALAVAVNDPDAAAALVPPDVTLELARGHLDRGDREGAMALLNGLLKNYNEDPAMMRRIHAVFDDYHLGAEGDALIASAAKEIADINNRGVQLVKEGKLDEAIGLFEQAAERLPRNKTVNLNAAQVLIMAMQRSSAGKGVAKRARRHLDRVSAVDPNNEKLLALMRMYHGQEKA